MLMTLAASYLVRLDAFLTMGEWAAMIVIG